MLAIPLPALAEPGVYLLEAKQRFGTNCAIFFALLTQFMPVKKVRFEKMIGCFFLKKLLNSIAFSNSNWLQKERKQVKLMNKSWYKTVPNAKKDGTKLCQNRNLMYPTKHQALPSSPLKMGTRFPYALSLFFHLYSCFAVHQPLQETQRTAVTFLQKKIGAYKWALLLNFFSLITEEDLEKQLVRKKGRQIQEIAA